MNDEFDSEFGFENAGIGGILRSKLLRVPANQRPYAWRHSNVIDLLNDFKEAMAESDERYFLGTVVLVHGDDRQLIADGQQRIATATIILARARDLLRSLGEEKDAISTEGDFIKRYVRRSKDDEYILQMNIEDDEFFRTNIIDCDWISARPSLKKFSYPSNQRLFDASEATLEFMYAEVNHLNDSNAVSIINKWITFIEERAFVVAVTVPDEVGAFRMFETLNDRGLRASQADILKNYFFSKVKAADLSQVQAFWNQIYGALSDRFDDPDERMVEYIRHFWTLKSGLTRQRDLANAIKAKIRNAQQSMTFLREAKDAVNDYVAIFNSEHSKWKEFPPKVKGDIFVLSNVINIEQIVPLVFAVASKFEQKEAAKAFGLFVVWSVRFILGQSGRAGRLDKQYAELAHCVGQGLITTARGLREKLADKVPSDEAFARSVQIAKVSKSVLARYYLIEFEKARCQRSGELEPSKDISKVNLEHILPQTFSRELGISKPEFDDLISRLGNQTIMLSDWNRDLGNLPFSQKKATYQKSDISFTSDLATLLKFDRQEIDARQKEMAQLAPKIWSTKF